jgi:hypothetical protein
MRKKGKDNSRSLSYKATQRDTGLTLEFIGIRAFCRSMWGENPDGTPRNITRAIDMSNGKRGVKEVKGWVIEKVATGKPKVVDPIGDYLRAL